MAADPAQDRSHVEAGRRSVRTDQLLGIDRILVAAREPTAGRKDTAATPPDSVPAGLPTTNPTPARGRPLLEELTEGAGPAELLSELEAIYARERPLGSGVEADRTIVFGEGNPCAELMFIGEAPGEEEDRTGRPFVGRAGRKLDEMIAAMGFAREEVYIANVLKTRPPQNRTPLQDEVDASGPFLEAQVSIVRPDVIVALGGPAAKLLLRTEAGITRLRGRWGSYLAGEDAVPVMPTFHPAYLLRNPTLEVRSQVWEDLQAVLERLGRPIPGR
ncbi:MAG: uracil-DNA glycosylase [Planctomycetota bacterium]|nr:uracil-DNA glycosylase [Planctomycetota bacterium]